jgi:hypothetical protein
VLRRQQTDGQTDGRHDRQALALLYQLSTDARHRAVIAAAEGALHVLCTMLEATPDVRAAPELTALLTNLSADASGAQVGFRASRSLSCPGNPP